MIRTIEATIDEHGTVHLNEAIELLTSHRALVTILEEKPQQTLEETALLSQEALAEDWDNPEEDMAWSHL
ncbi:hypothetical protein [Capsulimonas corticalis]|nr:hypothetical protein [Capsulimonas corticalis]